MGGVVLRGNTPAGGPPRRGAPERRCQDREYRVSLTVADYLTIRETVVKGRFMRHTLGEVQWERFSKRVAEVFQSRFQNPIEYTNKVLLAVGTKRTTS